MELEFTKMHGAGNDFIVIDATRHDVALEPEQWRWLAHRHFGVGADQILLVQRPRPDDAGIDFVYRIVNADGSEVENCGNGARCFMRFVQQHGLTDRERVRVRTAGGVIELASTPAGDVRVDMGAPRLDEALVPFSTKGLASRTQGRSRLWPLALDDDGPPVWIEAVSMGNPHAVQFVDDVDAAPVERDGPRIESHPRFARRTNAGFVQVVAPDRARVRVYERGAGETLACGTGICAAVVSGIRRGLFEPRVEVQARGGRLTIEWDPLSDGSVVMTGPAQTVFTSRVDVPSAEHARRVLNP